MAIEIKEGQLCYFFHVAMCLNGAKEPVFYIHGAWFLTPILIKALFIHKSLTHLVIPTLTLTTNPLEIIICPL